MLRPVTWAWYLAVPFAIWAFVPFYLENAWYCALMLGGVLVTANEIRVLNRSAADQQAVLNAGLDKSWTRAAIDALQWPSSRVRRRARAALPGMLNALNTADCAMLDEPRREVLRDQLRLWAALRDPDMAASAAHAVGAAGDLYSAPLLDRLSQRRLPLPGARRVRRAAFESLAALKEHRARELAGRAVVQEAPAQIVAAPEEVRGEGLAEDASTVSMAGTGRQRQPALRLTLHIVNWAVVVPYFLSATVGQARAGDWPAAGGLLALALLYASFQRYALRSADRAGALRLGASHNKEDIGRMLDVLTWPDESLRAAVLPGIQRVMPQLMASDAALLSQENRAQLNRLLSPDVALRSGRLALAVLKGLEQVGDAQAIPAVSILASAKPKSPAQVLLRDAACECLPYLQSRAEQQARTATLLRASSAGAESELLRSGVVPPADEAEQLLRSG